MVTFLYQSWRAKRVGIVCKSIVVFATMALSVSGEKIEWTGVKEWKRRINCSNTSSLSALTFYNNFLRFIFSVDV